MSFKWPSEKCCIVTHNDNWYCRDCKKGHGRLYVNNTNGVRYCPDCVPEDVKKESIDINQNCEVLDTPIITDVN